MGYDFVKVNYNLSSKYIINNGYIFIEIINLHYPYWKKINFNFIKQILYYKNSSILFIGIE